MKPWLKLTLGIVVVVVGIATFMSLYTVNMREQALVIQFGEPIKVIEDPGLHFKWPWRSVTYFDKRVLDYDARTVEVPDPGFVHDLDAMAEAITDRTREIFIANPNNPTGTLVGQGEIDRFMERVPEGVIVIFDEAYYEFLDSPPDTLKPHSTSGRAAP